MDYSFDQFKEDCVILHNNYRALHGSPELAVNEKMNHCAQKRAESYAEHERVIRRTLPYGENTYVSVGIKPSELRAKRVVGTWYNAVRYYKFNGGDPQDPSKVSSFAQLVWKSTSQIGVGIAMSDSNEIYVVCIYDPPGNVKCEFAANVLPIPEVEPDDILTDDQLGIKRLEPREEVVKSMIPLHAVPSEKLRVWTVWLWRLIELAYEWHDWLKSGIDLVLKIALYPNVENRPRAIALSRQPRKRACDAGTANVEKPKIGEADRDGGDEEGAEKADRREEAIAESIEASEEEERVMKWAIGVPWVPVSRDEEERSEPLLIETLDIPDTPAKMMEFWVKFTCQATMYRSFYKHWLATAKRATREILGREVVSTYKLIGYQLRDIKKSKSLSKAARMRKCGWRTTCASYFTCRRDMSKCSKKCPHPDRSSKSRTEDSCIQRKKNLNDKRDPRVQVYYSKKEPCVQKDPQRKKIFDGKKYRCVERRDFVHKMKKDSCNSVRKNPCGKKERIIPRVSIRSCKKSCTEPCPTLEPCSLPRESPPRPCAIGKPCRWSTCPTPSGTPLDTKSVGQKLPALPFCWAGLFGVPTSPSSSAGTGAPTSLGRVHESLAFTLGNYISPCRQNLIELPTLPSSPARPWALPSLERIRQSLPTDFSNPCDPCERNREPDLCEPCDLSKSESEKKRFCDEPCAWCERVTKSIVEYKKRMAKVREIRARPLRSERFLKRRIRKKCVKIAQIKENADNEEKVDTEQNNDTEKVNDDEEKIDTEQNIDTEKVVDDEEKVEENKISEDETGDKTEDKTGDGDKNIVENKESSTEMIDPKAIECARAYEPVPYFFHLMGPVDLDVAVEHEDYSYLPIDKNREGVIDQCHAYLFFNLERKPGRNDERLV